MDTMLVIMEGVDDLKFTSIVSLIIIVAIFICCIGCEEKILIPGSSTSEFDPGLVDYWTLIEADNLMEGDLIIEENGVGIEYGIYGHEILRQNYNFENINYTLTGDILEFLGRKYKRLLTRKKCSDCSIIPDEGLVKLFLIDNTIPMVVKVGYNSESDLFYKKRSVWSPQFGFEVDTLWLKIEEDQIKWLVIDDPSDINSVRWTFQWIDPQHYKEPYFNDPFEGPPIWKTIYDTTIASKYYTFIFEGPVYISGLWSSPYFNREKISQDGSYLERFHFSFAHISFAADNLGIVYAEWKNNYDYNHRETLYFPPFHHRVSLIDHYNLLDRFRVKYEGVSH
jgi:hypothetical protein